MKIISKITIATFNILKMKTINILKRRYQFLLIFAIIMQVYSCSYDPYQILYSCRKNGIPTYIFDTIDFKNNAIFYLPDRTSKNEAIITSIDNKSVMYYYPGVIFLSPGNHTFTCNYNYSFFQSTGSGYNYLKNTSITYGRWVSGNKSISFSGDFSANKSYFQQYDLIQNGKWGFKKR